MSLLYGKSVILEHWLPVAVSGLVLVLCLRWIRNTRRESVQKSDPVAINAENEYPDSVQEYPDADTNHTPALTVQNFIPYPGAKTKTFPGGVDSFYEIIRDRRSVRHFSSRQIDLSAVEKAIQCAGTSPSGAHCEPWTFCMVTSTPVKQQIRDVVENEEFFNYKQRMARQWTADLKPFKTNHVKEYLTSAPCLILVFKQTYGTREDGQRKEHYYNEISTSIATGILLCALQSAGLSALVTTPLNCGPALRQILNRPANEKLLVLLPVGYPSEDCLVPDLKRAPLDKILVRYD